MKNKRKNTYDRSSEKSGRNASWTGRQGLERTGARCELCVATGEDMVCGRENDATNSASGSRTCASQTVKVREENRRALLCMDVARQHLEQLVDVHPRDVEARHQLVQDFLRDVVVSADKAPDGRLVEVDVLAEEVDDVARLRAADAERLKL